MKLLDIIVVYHMDQNQIFQFLLHAFMNNIHFDRMELRNTILT